MRNRIGLVLTSWPFLCALAVLVANDWWLKPAYPGFVTGKLSDFAGLAVVTLTLVAAWPARARTACLGIALLFVWWKSPFSEALIRFFNAHAPIRIGRTIDYGDLVALVMLPICASFAKHGQRFVLPWPACRKVLLVPVIAVTAFATMATSISPARRDYEIRRTPKGDEIRRESLQEAIALVAARHELTSNVDGSMVYRGNGLTLSYWFLSPDRVAFFIEAWPSGALWFSRSGSDRADALQSDIRRVLAQRFKGLELVEEVKSDYHR